MNTFRVILNEDGSILLKPRKTRAPRLKYGDVIDRVIDKLIGEPNGFSTIIRSHSCGAIHNACKKLGMKCTTKKLAKPYRFKVTRTS